MKDKRVLLKIASILGIIYSIGSLLYILLFNKLGDNTIINIFFTMLSIYISSNLYIQSKKNIEELKKNSNLLIILSAYLLIDSIIPGILGFVFLYQIKDKKKKKEYLLPKVEEKSIGKIDIIKSVLLILFFVLVTFVLPLLKFYNKIPLVILYLLIFLIILIINFKYLKDDLLLFKKHYKVYIPFIIKRYLIMLGIMFLVAIPIYYINNGAVSSNQELINKMFVKSPLLVMLLSSLYAPFVEENVFRLGISKLLKNKYLFIIISGLLFGVLHMIDKITSIYDVLYIVQYSALGICLAKAYYDSKNIYVSIGMHFLQNFFASILMLASLIK